MRLLGELGLMDRVRAVGVRAEAMEYLRWQDCATLMSSPMGALAEAEFGAPILNFLRADLQDVLVSATPPGVLRLGARVSGVRQDAGGVSVSLADGSVERADVVVAADGIRSPIRAGLLGGDAPVYSGTVVYRGQVPRAQVPERFQPNLNRYILGGGRHVVMYWVDGGRAISVNVAIQRPEPCRRGRARRPGPAVASGPWRRSRPWRGCARCSCATAGRAACGRRGRARSRRRWPP